MKKHKFFILLLPLSMTIPFIAISCTQNNPNLQESKKSDKTNKNQLKQKNNKQIIIPQQPKTNNTINSTDKNNKSPQNTQNQTKNTKMGKSKTPNSNSNLKQTPKLDQNQNLNNNLNQPQQPKQDSNSNNQNNGHIDKMASDKQLDKPKKQENSTQQTGPENSLSNKSENKLPKPNIENDKNTQESPSTQKESTESSNPDNVQKQPQEPKTKENTTQKDKKQISDEKNKTQNLNQQKGESINQNVNGFQNGEFKVDYIYANAKNLVFTIKGVNSNENYKNYEFYLSVAKPGTGFWPIKAIVNAKEDYASITITKLDSILKHKDSEDLIITLSYKPQNGQSQKIEWPGHRLIVKGQRIVVEKTN
ncbi:variable surface lipoprotein [Mycoplasma zalophi]|uniref:variable surface lipoprotein n=1 Tax=Mycoplasma zalophi TaxID=191287 RepID=UPI001C104242|nr:variable surface lipoprotein [Mycoplasma zalophi]MBU4691177.1 hypothetical protein [Mycoplasma zalophi]